MEKNGFLYKKEDLDRFAAQYVTRRYVTVDAEARKGNVAPIEHLLKTLLHRQQDQTDELTIPQRILAIRGEAGQGLTWAAQEAYEQTRKSDPPEKKMVLFDTSSGHEILTAEAGWRTVRAALRAKGIRTPRPHWMSQLSDISCWFFWAVLCAALFESLVHGSMLDPLPLILCGVATVSGFAWRALAGRAQEKCTAIYGRFLSAAALPEGVAVELGRLLGKRFLRDLLFTVVIIDHYSRLGPLACAAIQEALREPMKNMSVTWIVYDSVQAGLFMQDLQRIQHDAKGLHVTRCELIAFNPEDRGRIGHGGKALAISA